MAIRIKQLRCRVRVQTGKKATALFQDSKSARPSLHFATRVPNPNVETGPEPSQIAPEEQGVSAVAEQRIGAAKRADARQVSDRVYELMKQELLLARNREGRF